jgi:hypothetical protein
VQTENRPKGQILRSETQQKANKKAFVILLFLPCIAIRQKAHHKAISPKGATFRRDDKKGCFR